MTVVPYNADGIAIAGATTGLGTQSVTDLTLGTYGRSGSGTYSYNLNQSTIDNIETKAKVLNLSGKLPIKYRLRICGSGINSTLCANTNLFTLVTTSNQVTNTSPILSLIGNKTIAENSTLTINLSATDSDADTLYYTGSGLPQGSSISGNTFTWKPSFTQSGNYTFTFIVSDGRGGTDTEAITVFVTNTNRGPIANAGNDQIINTLSSSVSGGTSYDPDGNSLNFSWSKVSGPGTVTFSNPNSASTNATFSNYGPHVLRLTVSDGNLSSSDEVSVAVQLAGGTRRLDTDGDGKNDEIDYCPDTPSTLKTEANTFGCIRPKVTKFDIRPDLEKNLNSVKSVEFGKNNIGKILFNDDVKLTRNSEILDIDRYLEISSKKVTLDSSLLPELNKSAKITFYNINIDDPKILKDGVECKEPDCVIESFEDETLVFTVKGFSTYEVVENENNSSSGGGGGGGGSGGSKNKSTNTSSTIDLPQNATREQLITYLIAKIQELLLEYNRIKALEGNTTTDTVLKGFQFTKTFGIGTNDPEVRYLQRFLNTHGFPVGTALGSYGQEINTFGPVTKATLIKYQLANGIEGTGYFGPITRSRVNQTLLSE